jgi:vancomycin permeability regulator SanA
VLKRRREEAETDEAEEAEDAPAPRRADPGARIAARNLTFGPDSVTSGDERVTPETKAPRRRRKGPGRLIMLALVALAVAAAPVGYLSLRTRPWRHSLDAVPAAKTVIVLGTGRADADADLVAAADQLRRDHMVRDVLLLGAEFAGRSATATGAATADAGAGSIYDGCHRANRVHGLTAAVLITTPDQLNRALYACRQLGVAVVGVGVGPAPGLTLSRTTDAVRTIWRVHVSRPGPRYEDPGQPG